MCNFKSALCLKDRVWQTKNPVQMHDEAICINHKNHTIKSAIKWQEED